MPKLKVWIQRASEDNYSFITNKPIQNMTREQFLDFILSGLKAGDRFMLKPGDDEIDISVYYYDFLT